METKKIAYSVSEETSRWIDLINRFDRVYDDANEVIHELYVNPENLSDEIYDVAEVFRTFLYKCLTIGIREKLCLYSSMEI